MRFSQLQAKPNDPILALFAEYLENTNPNKVNLSIGLYFEEHGRLDMMTAARKAGILLANKAQVKDYLPIQGDVAYLQVVNELVFGKDHPVLPQLASVQTLAATGGLRTTADALRDLCGAKRCLVSDPTWSNHTCIFESAGYQVYAYPYFDHDLMSYNFKHLVEYFDKNLQEKDVVLMHPVCHNPTGADLTLEQWKTVFALIKKHNAILVLDQAYLGYGKGLEEDGKVIRLAAQELDQFVHIFSSSKTFGLYGARIGHINIKCASPEQAAIVTSNLKLQIRASYSTNIANGASMVHTMLTVPELRQEWQVELESYRVRLNELRKELVKKLQAKDINFSYILDQYGFFSFLKLSVEQIRRLRNEFGIYLLDSGRINFAGLNQSNLDYVVDSISQVCKG